MSLRTFVGSLLLLALSGCCCSCPLSAPKRTTAAASSADVTATLTDSLRDDAAAASALCGEKVSGLEVTHVELLEPGQARVTGTPIAPADEAREDADVGAEDLDAGIAVCIGVVGYALEPAADLADAGPEHRRH